MSISAFSSWALVIAALIGAGCLASWLISLILDDDE